jgi:Na+/serine symporter
MAYKPANIMIKRLLDRYKPAEETPSQGKNAGAFIGTLERIIMLALLSVGQYSAIGLVLTAKSVARYNKIAEEKNFAEYYLLGTLLSALYAIAVYFLFLQ